MASRKVHKDNSPDGLGQGAVSKADDGKKPRFFDPLEVYKLDLSAPPYLPAIDEIVEKLTNPEGRDLVPGVAVAVRRDNEIVHLKCYGYANLETRSKITLETIFDLGSLSKQFTAFAIMYLIHFENKLNLDDHLSKFFNNFPRYSDAITVEDLLHHTSALPDYAKLHVESRRIEADWYDSALANPDDWYPEMLYRTRKEVTNKDVLRWIASQTLLAVDPDTKMDYSNSGYVVLAELVQRVTKKRLAQYLKQILLRDVFMNDTYVFDERSRFANDAREIVNHAKCYNHVKGRGFVPVGYTPLNFIFGDGNVHSTILDLLRWETHLYSNEFWALVDPEFFAQAGFKNFSEYLWTPGRVKNGRRVDYGAGWNLQREKYERVIKVKGKEVTRRYESLAKYHRGEWLGWRHYWARAAKWGVPQAGKHVDPETFAGLSIIVLSNAEFGDQQFTTCSIAQEISKTIWRGKDNIMRDFNCANG